KPIGADLRKSLHGSVVDRRQQPRRGGDHVPVLLSDAPAQANPFEAWVVDRSAEGLCIRVDRALAAGTILSVRASQAREKVPWVQLETKTGRQGGGEWEIGCRFLQPPPLSVLLLFG